MTKTVVAGGTARTSSRRDRALGSPPPFQGEGRGGDGVDYSISVSCQERPHPHPNLPLEGEGISTSNTKTSELALMPRPAREVLSGTVIIGMGNPLLSDDGVGIAVAHAVAERLRQAMDLTVVELHTGGIRLMEAMAGFRRAVVVDAMLSGAVPGTLKRFDPHDFVTTKNTFSSHDTDFATAYDLGLMARVPLPERVSFWGIEAREFDLFGERFTDEVTAALPGAVSRIIAEIIEWEAAA